MTREIKFRVWDNIKNRFIEKGGDVWFNAKRGYFQRQHEVLDRTRFIPLQYTGLKDKNGKEIYEGDIVKFIWACGGEIEKVKGIVYYDLYDITWKITKQKNKHKSNILDNELQFGKNCGEELEVIGNKFENPELLK